MISSLGMKPISTFISDENDCSWKAHWLLYCQYGKYRISTASFLSSSSFLSHVNHQQERDELIPSLTLFWCFICSFDIRRYICAVVSNYLIGVFAFPLSRLSLEVWQEQLCQPIRRASGPLFWSPGQPLVMDRTGRQLANLKSISFMDWCIMLWYSHSIYVAPTHCTPAL